MYYLRNLNRIDINYDSQVDVYGIQFQLSAESIAGITATSDYFDISEFNGNFIGVAKFTRKASQKLKERLNYFKNNYKDYYTLAIRRLIN